MIASFYSLTNVYR